jgi:catechol 2,3-dioxygenase-like lactoylglutathione lyase family enzyme
MERRLPQMRRYDAAGSLRYANITARVCPLCGFLPCAIPASGFGRYHGRMIALDNGFQEVVGIVADADQASRRLARALGYDIAHAGDLAAPLMAAWGPHVAAHGREVLIAHPDVARGAIRLLSFAGEPAPLMRDGAQPWDSGGIFDINIRALDDIETLHHALGRAGHRAFAPITNWHFGALAVREVVENDADGLCIALMQRVQPPLQGYEGVGGNASWVFNSTQVVTDFAQARALFVDHLGWVPVQETEGFAGNAGGINCMGLPLSIAGEIPMRIGIYQAQGRMEGSVEIISFGVGGHDFSAARPPSRGWGALRFPVSDIEGFARAMVAGGCEIVFADRVEWAPHGSAELVSAITPWGARMEAIRLG